MLANSFSDSCFYRCIHIVLCCRAHHCSVHSAFSLCMRDVHSFTDVLWDLRIWPLRQSVQERRYHEIMTSWIALFGGPALSSSAQGLLSQISLKYKTVRANPNTGRAFHACHRMISASSAVVLGFGLQEHLEDTSWPFNSSLQAVPSVCKMIQINNY